MTHTPPYDFPLDDFQRRAMDAVDEGRSVLVAAPTGSGKTVVAEHAVADALARGGKAFYTTPIKALSNQKYADLARRHGADRVGLLTGDNSINGDAPVVVMTTEVLRNMIYAGSGALGGLRWVVLDEVHYLQDPYRGPVWEEVIIHLDPGVGLICLSATASNAEELSDWISTVRGPTATIIEERRPVELHNLYLVGDRSAERPHLLPTLVQARPNPQASRLDAEAIRGPRRRTDERPGGRRLHTPRRAEVIDRLDDEGMLPAIYFIFSRAACDDAVTQLREAGVRLTSREERDQIRAICGDRLAGLSGADLEVLRWQHWMLGMEAGIAAHHAGMVPPFKEAVEACFTAGLVKVVFATETLALGINMPARAVVIEKLSKFTGERHEMLTPGQYTQLTGRAGRRGIDEVGYAVVLWSPFVTFEQVAALVSTRTFAISSAFRPTYNMAANLIRRYDPETAQHLLGLSFAQYQADRDVVRIEAALDRSAGRLAREREGVECRLGDAAELVDLERRLAETRRNRPSQAREVDEALARLTPGDVVRVPGGKSGGPAVVLTATRRHGNVKLRVLTATRRRLSLGPDDFPEAPRRLGRVALPEPYQPNSTAFQREVAGRLARAKLGSGTRSRHADRRADATLEALTKAVADHPVAACPDLVAHRRAAVQVERLERERERLHREAGAGRASLVHQLERVLEVLERWGCVDGWSLTDAGVRLCRIYHEADLLLAESIGTGLLDGLDPPSLAGLVSTFTFEARGPGEPPVPWFPSGEVRTRWARLVAMHARLVDAEEAAGLPTTRPLDPGFVALAYAWAAGDGLSAILEDEELSGGDFVRNVKQLIDLLRQVGDVAPVAATATAAREAADALFRGVVSASSSLGVDDDGSGGER
ncbi:MAG TPA: DEAD/DEAH box helicase [Acidimicrobiales bacterium]|nr:DEAD/DEAH box helicase [Acidimicrobiales bacterium]